MVVDEGQLEAEEQEKLQQREEAARLEAQEREAARLLAEQEAKQRRGLLASAFQRPPAVLSKLTMLPFRKANLSTS